MPNTTFDHNSASSSISELEETRRFWNASPCDGQDNFEVRKKFRYTKDAFIPFILEMMASRHTDIVEIGCGQGTDGLTLCHLLPPGAKYRGYDYSDESLSLARQATEQAVGLSVTPLFMKGNAENLEVETDTVECVYSLGVLHHTPDTIKSIKEVFRRFLHWGSRNDYGKNR